MSTGPSLWTKDFIFFNFAVFLAFINFAVFFSFEEYLRTLPIPPQWFGLLIGLFSAVALVLRPFISARCRSENARRWIAGGTLGVMAALFAYGWAERLWSMALLRLFHGAAHVLLATALMTVIVQRIPPAKSGQAFGLLSIVTLLPYAVIPPLLPSLTDWLGGYPRVLAFFGLVMVLIFPLILRGGPNQARPDENRQEGLSGREIRRNFRDPQIWLILTAMMLFYSGYAIVFFFLAGYAGILGVVNAGLFFTLSTCGEIGIRVIGSALFDRTDKRITAAVTLGLVAGGYWLLAGAPGTVRFFILGGFLGLGWGVVMPVLNALLFDCSPDSMRAFNTNLGLQMFQGGYFVGPLLGALILSRVAYDGLYIFCAVLALLAGGLLVLIPSRKEAAVVCR